MFLARHQYLWSKSEAALYLLISAPQRFAYANLRHCIAQE
jgi:hypothetical protein